MPRALSPTQFKLVKALLFAAALVPGLRLFFGALQGNLGANPIEFMTRATGDWTLYLLCATLLLTPLRRLTKWNWLVRLRRMLGLFVFFYASWHFLTFLWFDHFFDVAEMLKDAVKRPFILFGLLTYVGLIPLAVTSNKHMIKRLGGKRWQQLHKSIYGLIFLALLHFWWMKAGKNDFAEPLLWSGVVAVLLGVRLYGWVRTRSQQVAETR